jgi:hypothetical protein
VERTIAETSIRRKSWEMSFISPNVCILDRGVVCGCDSLRIV